MNRKPPVRRPNPVAPHQDLMADTAQLIQDHIAALSQARAATWRAPDSGGGMPGAALFDAVMAHGIGSAAASLKALAQVQAQPRRGESSPDCADVIDVTAREVIAEPGSRKEA